MPHIFVYHPDSAVAAKFTSIVQQARSVLRQLGDDLPVIVEPVSRDTQARACVSVRTSGVHIGLARDASAVDVAHEAMHVRLDLEGYPTYAGQPDSGAIASVVLDSEVHRRVELAGFDHTALTDEDHEKRARSRMRVWHDHALMSAYVVWNSSPTRLPSLRAAWRERVRRERPAVARLGEAILTATRGGREMQTAAAAAHAMTRVQRILLEARLPVGHVAFLGPEIEHLRRTEWPRVLQELERHAQSA